MVVLAVCEATTHPLTVLQLKQQKLLREGEETIEQTNQETIDQQGETRIRVREDGLLSK